MKVVIRGVHLTVGPSLRDHVHEQLGAPLQKMLPQDAAELDVQLMEVSPHRGGQRGECRVTLHIPNAPAVHLTEVSDDLYKSVALIADRLVSAARRHLDRHRDHPPVVITEGLL